MFCGGAEARVRPGVEKASGDLDSEPQRLPILLVVRGGEREWEEGSMRMGGVWGNVAWPGKICGGFGWGFGVLTKETGQLSDSR